jgi:hypothetical protein
MVLKNVSRLDKVIVAALVVTLIAGVTGFLGLVPGFAFTTTKYAAGYTEAAFNKIAIGDSEEKVLKMLGEPFVRHNGQARQAWFDYSKEGWALWFHRRRIALSNSVVIRKISTLDTD